MDECRQLAGNRQRKLTGKKDTGQFEFQHITKSIAYLLGAYLSDGTVSQGKRGWSMFTLEVIDQDFAEHVQEAINQNTRQVHNAIFIREAPSKRYYKAYSGNQELCRWLVDVTQDKRVIPGVLVEAEGVIQKAFIAGLMDGDGWICVGKRGRNPEANPLVNVGFACTDPWIHDLVAMARKLGAVVYGPRRQENGGVKPLYAINFNKESFLKAGLYFTIGRKQKRLMEYKERMTGSPETKREPSLGDEEIVRPG